MSVAVLLATFNGRRFLEEQLGSLAAQTTAGLDILASDDGSTDGTLAFLQDAAAVWNKGTFRIIAGPRTGNPADNFRALILSLPAGHDYVAYCDQDDVWLPHKLSAAIAVLEPLAGRPAVHCSRTRLIGEDGAALGVSTYFRKPPEFRNALVQSLAGGNTMILNRAAFELMRAGTVRATRFVSHDWWTYQLVSGAGGTVVYAREPDTLYRQHGANAVGSNRGPLARLRRLWMILRGQVSTWNDINLAALEACRDLLTPEARQVLADFGVAHRGGLMERTEAFRRSGVFRQRGSDQLAFRIVCALGLL